MKITQNDVNETTEVALLITKIDSLDAESLNSILDEIFLKQPFFLTVLLGHRFDVSPQELEEIMKIYLLIWEYFKSKKNVQRKKVTEGYFEQIQDRNIQMLKYAKSEPAKNDKQKIYSNDLENLKSKALLTAVLYRYINRPILLKMDEEKKGTIYMGIKTFIECFEAIE